MRESIEKLSEIRREAYVKAIMKASTEDNVVGYIGKNLPLDIFYAFSLYFIPVWSADRDILEFSDRRDLCGAVNGTVTYLTLDKCPLLHSSKLIVLEDMCPQMTEEMLKAGDERVYLYSGEQELIQKLLDVYGGSFIEEKRTEGKNVLFNMEDVLCKLKDSGEYTTKVCL